MWFRRTSISRLRARDVRPQISETLLPSPVSNIVTAPRVQEIQEVFNPQLEQFVLAGIGGTFSIVGDSFVHRFTVVGTDFFVVSASGITG
jgi:hypothetical protein